MSSAHPSSDKARSIGRKPSLVRQRLLVLGVLTVTALAGAAGALWQHQDHVEGKAKKAADGRLFSWADPGQIRRLDLTGPAGHLVVEHHAGEQVPWRVVEPLATAAESSSVDALLTAVLGASQQQEVQGETPDTPPDLTLFGLAKPRMTLVLTGPDGQQERLEVGDKNTFNDTLFVRRGGRSEIVTCPTSVEQALDKQLFDLRDKRVVALPSNTFASIQVEADGAPAYSLSHQGDSWRLTAPISAPASRSEAEALAGAIGGLRAKSFVAEHGPAANTLKAHGLTRPLYRVTLTDTTQATGIMRVGRAVAGPSDVFYAQMEPHGPIVELGSDWVVKKLSIGLWELRDRTVASFKPDQVARITLREGTHAVYAARHGISNAPGAAARWTGEVAADGSPGSGLDPQKVTALLQRLSDIKATGVVLEAPTPKALASHGLGDAALEVVLEGEAAGDNDARPELARLRIARARPPHTGDRAATGAADGPLWRVASADLEGIEASLSGLAQAPEAPPETTAAVP